MMMVMMRKALVGAALFLALLLAADGLAAEGYRVILRNGSWVHARQKPAVDDGKARIRLLSGGVSVVAADSIDWEATERWNQEADTTGKPAVDDSRASVVAPPGTVTLVGSPPGSVSEERTPEPPRALLGTDDKRSRMRARYQVLEAELRGLRTQKRELELRASNLVNLDEAAKVRRQAADSDGRINAILTEQKSLLTEAETITSPVGDEPKMRQRIRFLDAEILKLRQEKREFERQAANMINLDEAKRVRARADALTAKIQSLEAERQRLTTRLSGARP